MSDFGFRVYDTKGNVVLNEHDLTVKPMHSFVKVYTLAIPQKYVEFTFDLGISFGDDYHLACTIVDYPKSNIREPYPFRYVFDRKMGVVSCLLGNSTWGTLMWDGNYTIGMVVVRI